MEYAKLINGKLTKLVRFPNGATVLDGKSIIRRYTAEYTSTATAEE